MLGKLFHVFTTLFEQEIYTIIETTTQCGDKSKHPNSKHNKLNRISLNRI